MSRIAILLGLLSVGLGRVHAGEADSESQRALQQRNWHQWRGPQASGVAPLADPPVNWSEDSNIRWKIEIPGRGTSTPIIWEDQVFILTAIKTDRVGEIAAEPAADAKGPASPPTTAEAKSSDSQPAPDSKSPREGAPGEGARGGRRGGPGGSRRIEKPSNYHQFVVLAIDRDSGKIRWQQVARDEVPHEGHHQTGSFAAGSPMTDGKHLYVSFGSRGIYCYELTGKLKWERDLGDMRTRNGFGEGVSPVLHGDSLVIGWDNETASKLFVLDARTGDTRWQVDRDEVTAWATPLVVDHQGRTQVIVSATNRVRSYDLASGKVLWECGGQTTNAIPCPVARDGVVICMSGFRGYAAHAIPLGAEGDLTDSDKLLWKHDRGTPYVPSPLLYGDELYFTEGNRSLLTCLDVNSGEPVIDRKRLEGASNFYASPIGAADRVYFITREGTGIVLKHARELEILATNPLDDAIDASPAAAGKQLFLRGEKSLYCLEEK